MKWLRSRAGKQAEPTGQHCTGCRSAIPGANDDELHSSGGVFLAGAGWFCGPRCERQYRLRFRIQTADPVRTPTPRPEPVATEPPEEPRRRPAADELADVLRARRRLNNG